jgi:PadR family transcriptional regulator, regulatory protein PadR
VPGGKRCSGNGNQMICRRHIRGFLQPCLLLLLRFNANHGYDLASALVEFGLGDLDPSLVYRMLRDLEESGLVTSEWQPHVSSGPTRRVYHLTADGEDYLSAWVQDLRETDRTLHHFLEVYDTRSAG